MSPFRVGILHVESECMGSQVVCIYAAVNWSMHSFIDARRSSETDRRRSKQKRLVRWVNEHVALSIVQFETIFYRRRGIIYRWPVA